MGTEGEHMLGVNTRLRWVGYFQRKDRENVGRRMLRMALHGRRSRGRPERRFMDVVKEDVEVAGVRGCRGQMQRTEEMEEEDSLREQLEEEHLSIIP